MITEKLENGVYTASDNGKVLCTITDLGDNVYESVNEYDIVKARITPIDEYITRLELIENKKKDKAGHFRKNTSLAEHNLKWLDYMLQEKGFIRKAKCR